MAFFPRFASNELSPLFRLLDDYDSHLSQKKGGCSSIRAFSPKFDVKELKDGYELHGELPGVDQKDVSIEFTDPHTLVIKGRAEREFTSGTPPAAIEAASPQPQIEDAPASAKPTTNGHHATVEDEEYIDASPSASSEVTKSPTPAEVAKPQQAQPQRPESPRAKYWVSERSVGEFHRSFAFPSRVDQESVKASLKNGILSIVVPKATAPTSRKINIE